MELITTDLHPLTPRPGGERNAPVAEDPRAVNLHCVADQLVTVRDRVAALDLWKREGREP